MTLDPQIMTAVERLGYRVTVGDVATQTGLELNQAESKLLALASEAGGHLQVAETGDVAYLFPRDFRAILRGKYFRLRAQEWWQAIWRVLFYLIRISFGIILIVSIVLIFLTIIIIITAASSSNRDNNNNSGGSVDFPRFWISPDLFWIFYPNYSSDRGYETRHRHGSEKSSMNFLEAVFSFLFGDGNPNVELEERRWRSIGTTIRSNGGAIVAEQITPYLDSLGDRATDAADEDYMLPVLTRFNGRPDVSPAGNLIYRFPDLQTTAVEERYAPVAAYLKEQPYRFSRASSGQLIGAIALGAVNLIGALALGNLLASGTAAAQLGGLVAFVSSIYWILLGYGAGFLIVPLIRYFWIQSRNRRIERRNEQRQERAIELNQADETLQAKLDYAKQFAIATAYLDEEDLAYTTERDLVEQEIEQTEQLDAEWQRRLEDH